MDICYSTGALVHGTKPKPKPLFKPWCYRHTAFTINYWEQLSKTKRYLRLIRLLNLCISIKNKTVTKNENTEKQPSIIITQLLYTPRANHKVMAGTLVWSKLNIYPWVTVPASHLGNLKNQRFPNHFRTFVLKNEFILNVLAKYHTSSDNVPKLFLFQTTHMKIVLETCTLSKWFRLDYVLRANIVSHVICRQDILCPVMFVWEKWVHGYEYSRYSW